MALSKAGAGFWQRRLQEGLQAHGAGLLRKGLSEKAIADLERVLSLGEAPTRACALSQQYLSSLYLRNGRLQRAQQIAAQAAETWRRVTGGRPSMGSAAASYHLGILELERGDLVKAMSSAEQSLHDCRVVHGQVAHRATGASLHLLASVLLKQGALAKAYTVAQESLAMRRELHHETAHPDLASSLLLVGAVLERQRQYDEAKAMFVEAIDIIDVQLKGTDSQLESSSAHRRLGSLLILQGRMDEAETELLLALKRSEEVHRSLHPDTVAAHHTLAVLYLVKQHFQPAQKHVEAAQAMQRQIHGEQAANHPRTHDLQRLLEDIQKEAQIAERKAATTSAAQAGTCSPAS